MHPRVELLLEIGEGGEGATLDEFATQRVMPTSDLARRGGTSRLREPVTDPVLATDLVEEDF
ncbi:MAG TPA: hypothetical protein VGG17_05610 [Acidimicrobiales bacterium]